MPSVKKSSVLLYFWTVFFFSLFSAIPLLMERNTAVFFLGWLIRMPVCALLILGVAVLWQWLKERPFWKRREHWLSDWVFAWVVFAVLMILSLPVFLAFYPGTIGADAPPQLAQYAGALPLTNHHPIAHTLLLGWIVDLGTRLFGSANAGCALYTAFQIILCNAALCKCLCWLRRRLPSWLVIVLGALIALNPYVQILFCYSTKDMPYAAALLLFVMYSCQFLFEPRSKGRILSLAGMILWGILMCLWRKQGIYMAVLVFVIALIAWRKHLKERIYTIWTGAQVLILTVSFVLSSVVPSFMGVPEGNMREMLSVPAQQIAQTINESLDENHPRLTPAQRDEAWSYFDDYKPETYDRLSADSSKDQLITDGIRSNPLPFLKVWLRSVFADFQSAVFAWTDLIAPYFDMRISGYFMGLNTIYSFEDYLDKREIHSASLLPGLKEQLSHLTTVGAQKTWGLALLPFDFTLCLYLMIYLLGYGWIKKKPRALFGVSYGFIYFLTLLLGPVALSRYLFVLVFQMPLWIGLLYQSAFDKKS